ncbi:fibronectin type III domain-containing protein [Marinobacter orientalis]|uniref:fibronectin type III domain-containing protein n=1 Tax=Marinobacter orientalis TaxID=1928859 RepID=UPI001D17F365|nr:fibronectin type III domain-containing protein [Marinobacter orientalis]
MILLSGCGLDINSGDSTTAAQSQGSEEPTVAIAGAAMKGVIQQGLVTANRLISDKDGYYAPQRQAAKPVLTADDGSYEWRLRGKADSWALVELQADSGTRMICDVAPQCEQNSAEPVAFGQPMSLDSNFSLRGAGDLRLETVNLTPLTHLAVALAERSANGLSPDSLSGTYQTVEGWFGLAAGSLRLTPPDLTRLDEADSVSADALQVAIANAAFLALVNNNAQWDSISEVLTDATIQVAETGQISLMGDGTNVALADLITVAAVQAAELQATVDSSIISQRLGVVQSRNVHHFKTVADVYEDTDTSVAETGETANDTTEGSNNDTTTDTTDDNTGSTEETAGTGGDTTGDTIADTDTGTDTSEPTTTETTVEETIPANAALLSWTAPLTRENGDSLAMGEIAGFEVVYGTSAEILDQNLAIGDASVDELLVDELTEGTWYFAIRTLDTDGNRSRLSEVVHKQI